MNPQTKRGDVLEVPCNAGRHGWRNFTPVHLFDEECGTCLTRRALSAHDHLHLDPDYRCTTPGLNGVPGVNVKCRCGAYHH